MLALCLLALLVAAEEPGAVPGPDTGFRPLPQERPPPPKEQPATQPETFVTPGGGKKDQKPDTTPKTDQERGYDRLKRKDPFSALGIFEEMLLKNPQDVGARAGKATAL